MKFNFHVLNGEGYNKPQSADGTYKVALGTEIQRDNNFREPDLYTKTQ